MNTEGSLNFTTRIRGIQVVRSARQSLQSKEASLGVRKSKCSCPYKRKRDGEGGDDDGDSRMREIN